MQASRRIAEEAPSSSRFEELLLNFGAFPLLHCVSVAPCSFCGGCCCCRSLSLIFFAASSTLDTILLATVISRTRAMSLSSQIHMHTYIDCCSNAPQSLTKIKKEKKKNCSKLLCTEHMMKGGGKSEHPPFIKDARADVEAERGKLPNMPLYHLYIYTYTYI